MSEEDRQPWKKCKKCGSLSFGEFIVRCSICVSVLEVVIESVKDEENNFDIVLLLIEEVVQAACAGTDIVTVQPGFLDPYLGRIHAARAAIREPVFA